MMATAPDSVQATAAALLERLAKLEVPLADLTADSRSVKRGSVFVAYPGTVLDGRSFISEAVARGAGAVLRLTLMCRGI